jgi:hypothetical protein
MRRLSLLERVALVAFAAVPYGLGQAVLGDGAGWRQILSLVLTVVAVAIVVGVVVVTVRDHQHGSDPEG